MSVTTVEGRVAHAAFVAWASLHAARSHLPRGFWDFYVGAGEAECLRYLEALATSSKSHFSHYSAFHVAEVDGHPAAAICGYFEEELGTDALLSASPEVDAQLGRSAEAARAGMDRASLFVTVIPEHPPGTWIIENVATSPMYRRRGLANRLLEVVIALGAQRGAAGAELGVLIGNDSAYHAYEKCGFRVKSERTNPEFERVWGSPGIRVLRLEL